MGDSKSTIFSLEDSRAYVHHNTYRIFCVLAGVLSPAFGVIYQITNPAATDPLWARFALALVALLLLVGSYMSTWVARRFIQLVHTLFYLLLAFYVGITALNGFSPNYTMGMMFAITATGVAFSLGLRDVKPLVRYLFTSVVLVLPVVFLLSEVAISPLIVSVCTISTALVIYMVARAKIEAEESMQVSRQRYSTLTTLMNAAEDAIFIVDPETRELVDANHKAQELTGRPVEELRQLHQSELFPEDKRRRFSQQFIEHAVNSNAVTEDLYVVHRSGGETPVDINASLISVGEKELIQGIFRDATKRHQYERKLIQAKERAEELLQLKTSLLNNMSHELRTPLTGILGFAEILAEEATGGLKEHAETIHDSANRLMKTLNSVLDLAQLESGQIDFEPAVLDLVEEVKASVDLLQPLAQKKGLELTVNIACAQKVYIRSDQMCLTRVVNNLVGNAIKFTNKGRVTVTVDEQEDTAYLSVQDTGIGIGQAFKKHLFEAFRQESTGLTRSHEGTGLGLTITNRLVQIMDGNISVESKKGKGSVFTVALPRIYPEVVGGLARKPSADQLVDPEKSPEQAYNRTLLVVEDNRDTRHLIELQLQKRFEICSTADPEEALQLAAEVDFDGFLLDISLGAELDGLDVLKALRKDSDYAGTPVVALTAYAMPDDEERFLDAGFDFYLPKPFTKQQLLATVEKAFVKEHEVV